jgi:hypothetical protein
MADDEVLTFLAARDATYCFRCLAAAFPRMPVEANLEAALRNGAPLITGEGTCAICRRATPVVAYIPQSPDLARMIRRISPQ